MEQILEERDRLLRAKDERIEALQKQHAATLPSGDSSHPVADSLSEEHAPAKRSQVDVDLTGTHRELLRVQDTAHATTAELKSLCEEAELTKSQLDAIRRLLREGVTMEKSSHSVTDTKRAIDHPPSSVEVSQLIDVLLRRLSKTEKRNRDLKSRNGLLESLYAEMRSAAGRESARLSGSAVGSRDRGHSTTLAAEVGEWAQHTDRHIHTPH